MPEVNVLPYNLVDHYRTGLTTDAGPVALDQYMSLSAENGGNDNCNSLLGPLRWMKDGGTGPTLNTILGGFECDVLLKGQGRPEAFVAVWNFMLRNKDHLKKIKVDVAKRRSAKTGYAFTPAGKKGSVYDLYFKGNGDAEALRLMVRDRFFGIDCIGFTANYMIFAGLWEKYRGYSVPMWGTHLFKKNVKKAADVKPLNLLLWGGHVALVDWVWELKDDRTVEVDVCQSSSSDEAQGPQCNERVLLRDTGVNATGGRRLFKVQHVGTPRMPVPANMTIMSMDGLSY